MSPKVIFFGVDGLMPELVNKFSFEGSIPNITRMMKEGASSQLTPFISTWGDLNWIPILTGQTPGSVWKGHGKSPDLENTLLGLLEEEGKRSALIYFPETISTEGTDHYNFAPFWGWKGEIGSPCIYSTHLQKWSSKEKKEFLGWPPTAGALSFHEKGTKRSIEKIGVNQYKIIIELDETKMEGIIETQNNGEVTLKIGEETIIQLEQGRWSNWTCVQFGTQRAWIRYKLMLCQSLDQEIDLIQSQVNLSEGLSDDPALEQFLMERCGPFVSNWPQKTSPDELYFEENYEDATYQAEWLAKAAISLLQDKNFDMYATVFRFIDEVQHTCLGEYDPESPFYTPEKAEICEKVIRKSYEILDYAVGIMLNEKSEDTLLILASDHGNVPNRYLCDIYKRLEQFDLIELDEKGDTILKKSRAFLKEERGGLEIYVNLKDTYTHGIVEKDNYEKVQTEIYRALTTWYHETPKGLQNVIALALKKQEAVYLGYWGPEAGDVIFAYSQGFVWGTNLKRDVLAPVTEPGANHGPQVPTSVTKSASNQALTIMHGPKINKGYKRNVDKLGPYFMHDLGTTMAKSLELDTSTLNGRFMGDLFIK